MVHASRLASVLAALGLAACGGGGDSTPAGSGITISGTVTAASLARMDSDTGDPRAPRTLNDTPGAAQAIPSAVTVGGWASATTDVLDVYRATLAAGQTVSLAIANAGTADLDLLLFTTADTMNPVCESAGTGPSESCPVAAPGEYYVVVGAFSGASNYVLTVGQGATSAGSPDPGALHLDAEFVPGEVVVRFRDDVLLPAAAETLAARAASVGLVPLGGAPRREMLLAVGPGDEGRARAFAALGIDRPAAEAAVEGAAPVRAAKRDTLRVVKALRRRFDVAGADPNYVHRPSLVPNDTFYVHQWHYPAMKLPQAWNVTTGTPAGGGNAPIVAVVDTGVVINHPDFFGQLVQGYDFISNSVSARDGSGIDPDPDDPGDGATAGQHSWHGTHVAGTVAAASNNGLGVAGVAWGAKVMPIRVLGAGGGTSYDIIQGIRYAARLSNDSGTLPARRADVLNLSLGCLACFAQTSQDAYTAVRAAGVVVVAAAGNENTSQRGYPASYDGVVSVSAVDMALARAPYSNYGDRVDVAAPGGDTSVDRDGNGYADGVLSTLVNESRQPIYSFLQGTSMASPHVAGVVALMKAACPTLGPDGLDGLLASGMMTVDRGAAGRDDVYGHGLVDALAAVSNCGTPPPATLSVTPSRLDFGTSATSFTLTASKVGAGALAVSFLDDAGWLTVTPATVDAEGIGTYTATVSRTGLTAGIHTATITFTAAPATITVPVTLQVGTGSGAGNAGHLYFLLVDFSTNPPRTVAQAEGNPSSGLYPFALGNVPSGTYFLVAGTDSDDDDFICDDGEACGAYPTIGVPTPIDATQSRSGLGFSAGFEVPLGSASPGGAAGKQGFRLLDGAKRVEVAP